MHIVVYSKPFFPQMGGLERNTFALCLALTEIGHRVTLVTETESEYKEYPFRVVRTQSTLEFYRQIERADFFVTNGGNVPLGVMPIAYLRGIPYGSVYHGFRGFQTKGAGRVTGLKERARQILARGAELNVFTSTHSKEATDVPEPTAHVLLNPVDKWLQKRYDGKHDRKKAEGPFLFAGRIIEGKGIFVLADALHKIDKEQQLELVVAGEGRDKDRFRRRVRHLETIDVTMAGRLDATDLVPLYQRSKSLIVPTTTHDEGNPLVIAEALYAGTPVIASDQPPMIESVGNAGIIVEGGDVGALAGAISRLNTDASYYTSLREKAESRASTFSYERYREKLKHMLRSVTQVS